MISENSRVRFQRSHSTGQVVFHSKVLLREDDSFCGAGATDSTPGFVRKTLEVSETSKKTRHSCQNAFGWLRFASEPGGQGDPGNADFGSDLASVVFGFAQVAPQGITDVLRVHSIFIRLLIRQRITENSDKSSGPIVYYR